MTTDICKMDSLELSKYISALLDSMGLNMPGESWRSIAIMIERSHPAVAKLLREADKRFRELE
jgi:hypothetical protein